MSGELFADGVAYERQMGRWSRLAGQKFLSWLEAPAGLNWLDAGCGNGAFTREIAEHAAPAGLTGIDPSPEQLAYAREQGDMPQARFELGDAQSLSFPDSAFDIAVMALVIAFLPEPLKAVREMARVVRPGGLVANYMWALPGGSPVNPIFAALESLGKMPVRPNPRASQLEAMQEFWRDAGLEDIETSVIRISVTYDDFDDFWTSNAVPIGPQGKMIFALSAEDREALRLRLRDMLPASPEGRITYAASANAIKGRVPAS